MANKMKKKSYFTPFILILVLFLASSLSLYAAEADWSQTFVETIGFDNPSALTDADYNTFTSAWDESTVTLSRSDEIHGLYLVFDRIPEPWQLTDPVSGKSAPCGTNGFLHEYIDVAELFGTDAKNLTLSFPKETAIADIYAFSAGDIPDWVQMWAPPCEEADLLLFTSHSDDEQLFFAGLLPLYAGEREYHVQVAYIVQHFQVYNERNHQRPHEQLNGLWEVGVTNYPVMSDFPDLYSESLEGAVNVFASVNVTEDDLASYMTECIRRFKPLVVVSHDPKGEYGHGTHILCTKTLMDVLNFTDNPDFHPESANRYGTWLPEKVYLHLYHENQIVLDLDTPLSSFDGKTAFEMTQHGFSFHKSQHWTWFYKWIYGTTDNPITKAAQITSYSPCLYGLYHTSVGYDTEGGDMFENVIPYAVRNAAAETEPVPDTTSPVQTEQTETSKPETVPAESEPTATETAPVPPDSGDSDGRKNADTLLIAILVILVIAVSAILGIYIFSLRQLNKGRKNRRRR